MPESSNFSDEIILKNMKINRLREFCHLHINAELEVVYLKSGSVTVTYDTDNFTLKPNEAMFILPYHPHAFYRNDDTDCDILMFPKSISGTFTDKYKIRGKKTVFKIDNAVAEYLDRLLNEYDSSDRYFTDKTIFYTLANLYLKDNHFPATKSFVPNALSKTIEYIKNHLSSEITIEQLAKNTGMNPRNLSNAFLENFGIKLIDFIANVRIEHALFHMESSSLSITEISQLCGFGSIRNFNRIFKNRVGITPSEYKKHIKQK